MRRRVPAVGCSSRLAVFAVLLLSNLAIAQQAALVSSRTAEIGQLLREGRQLELEDRWGEAISHYEEAIRSFPGERSLLRRFEFTRMHYDLRRRYCDPSFRDTLIRLSKQLALDLYCEVLVKIEAHHVEAPHWKELVQHGTNNLEVALSETPFLERHLPHAKRKEVDEFRHALRRELGPRVIQSREDARAAVALAAETAHKQLGLSPTAVILEYICGATNSLDPYSAYLTTDQLAEVYSQIEGNFVGLGIELKMEDSSLVIVRVIPGSPAEQAGVRHLDRIASVDGRSVLDLSTDQAANLLQGESGTIVDLSLVGPGETPRTVRVQRRRVEVPSIDRVQILDSHYGIGYLKLACFQKTTCRDLENALWKLHRAGMKNGLIIDLRGNPGGLLITAIEVVDKFLDQGVIVTTRGRSAQEGFTYSAHAAGTWRVPLVVLIDRDSASAAEIFAGAIRDHRRGTIVGRRSYGKGSVQGIFPLSCTNAGVRLTTAKFYSPKGHPYGLVGVEPDVRVQQVARPIDGRTAGSRHDPMLAAALEAARGRSKGGRKAFVSH